MIICFVPVSFVTFSDNNSGGATNEAFTSLDNPNYNPNPDRERHHSEISNGSANMLVSDIDVSLPTLSELLQS